MSVADNYMTEGKPDSLSELLRIVQTSDTIRTFTFDAVEDLHTFQAAITGFGVHFDGVATSFSISRRRMVVPIYKKWETNRARIQVVKQDKVVQMVVFLEDFSHGKCMNFQLKGTDLYESSSKSGKFYTRLVDAKFALPKDESSESREFVCLDIPEYPGEHDDIYVAFDSQAGKSSNVSGSKDEADQGH